MATLFAYCICWLAIPVMDDAILEIDGKTVEVQISPDSQHALFTRNSGRAKHLFLADREGKNVRQLTSGRHSDHSPSWSPDSKQILFCSTRSGKNQIFTIGSDGKQLKQITDSEHGSIMPKFSSTGQLSYLRLHPRQGKSRPGDLVVQTGKEQKLVMQNQDVSDYSWSHDGKRICYSTVNQINFYDLNTGKTTSVNTLEQDERLYSHGGYQMTWAPENDRVACRIRFLGGRFGDTKIFGDTEIFVIGVNGSFETVTAEDINKRSEAWIRKSFRK